MGKYTSSQIANYFLRKGEEDDELISNLKLQKLVYYAQGLHLALFNTTLFKESIRAWNYGPVVPGLYNKYKDSGSSGISANLSFNPKTIDQETRNFLDEVYEVLGQFSARRLMELTHTDQCWIDAHPNKEITHNAMKKALKKYVRNGEKK